MKGSDIVAGRLREMGLEFVFGLQGGAVVHLFDSCERYGPRPIYCHHEQAAGFAAAAYSRIKGFGACIVTTGPGATNAITPLLGAWQDSLPVLFISGQTRSQHTLHGTKRRVRQIGTQEANIIDAVKPWTVIALEISKIENLLPELEGAYMLMTKERPGPAWISIPLDIQYVAV